MSFRNVLQSYISRPELHRGAILVNDEDFLIIKDGFPKAQRHLLVIPKSPAKTRVHPLEAFKKDPEFLGHTKKYVEVAEQLIIDDLIESGLLAIDKQDRLARQEFANTLIKAGVHAEPSLSNLHVHVITQDFYSDRLKNKKHYNSFTTDFFVEISLFDEAKGGAENTTLLLLGTKSAKSPEEIVKDTPLRCCSCGQSFGNQFKKLKLHLEADFVKKFKLSRHALKHLVPNDFKSVVATNQTH